MTALVRFHCGHEIAYPIRVVAAPDVRFYWAAQSPPLPGGVGACLGCATPYRPTGEYRTAVERTT